MVFVGIYTALYDYAPQGENELAIQEGELLYVLEKSTEDDWWKAKKRAAADEEEEPTGLIPSNYVEEAKPLHQAKALFDYSRQTAEELSFAEDAILSVYDTSDSDWTLVGSQGEFGFAPANYIESIGPPLTAPSPSPLPSRRQAPDEETEREVEEPPTPTSVGTPVRSPAAALAGIVQRQSSAPVPAAGANRSVAAPPPAIILPPRRPTFTPDDSDEEQPSHPVPVLPRRPASQDSSPLSAHRSSQQLTNDNSLSSVNLPESPGVHASPPYNRARHLEADDGAPFPSPGGFHLYNVNEMVSALGKKKKMPTTLGINLATGNIMIAPEKSRDGPQQEWTAEKLTHYSIEAKHVFMDLVKPSKSIDFHAGTKDTAQEIVAMLGELAGLVRAEGLKEVIEAAAGGNTAQTKGRILYDFMAQGDDEVTVGVDDDVIIVDDTKSEEWWMVRRLKNGKEGVVPSSYVEVTGTIPSSSRSTSGISAGLSTVEQNRQEEQRLARESSKATRRSEPKGSEVGPGFRLPQRDSSLLQREESNARSTQRSKRESRSGGKSPSTSKPKPDKAKVRTWTDRTASFKVEAEFIGLRDGKIHLHKLNGVKIAVPVTKMSVEDLEYVERATGVSLDEDKPLSDIKRRSTQRASGHERKPSASASASDAAPIAKAGLEQPKQPEYDWFDFFLKCGVNPHQCERYASNFNKDSMDDSILPEITPDVLRTLGLKEGDILRVMKFLDTKYGRTGARQKRNVSFAGPDREGDNEDGLDSSSGTAGGLFSGPGGALRNNTRKGRPAPTVQTNDVIDTKAFGHKESGGPGKKVDIPEATATPLTYAPSPKTKSGFDDDAWDVKPSKQQHPLLPQPAVSSPAELPAAAAAAPVPPNPPALTGSMKELSLLSQPLQPTIAHNTVPQQPPEPQSLNLPQQPQQQQAQSTGAHPSFFSQLGQSQAGTQSINAPQAPPLQTMNTQPAYIFKQPPRQRPQAPQPTQSQGSSLMPPPPTRPLSAPQNFPQQSSFGPPPLQPQLTGYQNPTSFQPQIAPPGQSLNDLNQQRFQNQFNNQQLQPQAPGSGQNNTGFSQFGAGVAPQTTGYAQQAQLQQPQQTGWQPLQPLMNGQQSGSPFANPPQQQPLQSGFQNSQPFLNGQQTGSPFADLRQQQPGGLQSVISQPTGFQSPFHPQPQQQRTGSVNSFLPPALQPQPTGTNGFSGQGSGQPPPPIPPGSRQTSLAPLQPQKTGPAPPVRFGVTGEAKKIMPQATGMRANLSQASRCIFDFTVCFEVLC
ncbi:MAG: cytoskeletal protein binding protein [Candelina submexicana]|nr:MAG: cytoskeletal protein binding protein [Candelina submexicana]